MSTKHEAYCRHPAVRTNFRPRKLSVLADFDNLPARVHNLRELPLCKRPLRGLKTD
jgi:hypothetical protein